MTRSRRLSESLRNICAGAVGTLGLVVMLAWHGNLPRLVQIHPTFAPMQYNTALSFLLCGAAVFILPRARAFGALLGLVVLAVGLASLVEYVSGVSVGIDELLMRDYLTAKTSHPGLMSPLTATGFVLAGMALVALGAMRIAKQRTLIADILACLIGAFGTAATVGYLTQIEQAYAWTESTRMGLHTALGLVLLAIAILLTSGRLVADGFRGQRFLALPAGVGAIAVTLALAQSVFAWQTARVDSATTLNLDRVATDLDERLTRYVESFGALAEFWGRNGGTPERSWEADVARFLREHGVFQAIAWGDPDGKLSWIFPSEPFPNYIGLNYLQDPQRASAIETARSRGAPMLSGTLTLKSGVRGIIIVAPLASGPTDNAAFVVSAVRTSDLFRASATAAPRYRLEIFEGQEQIHGLDANGGSGRNSWTRTRSIQVDNVAWRVELTPSPATLESLHSPLPLFILLSGLVASCLFVLTVHLAQVSARRSDELLVANSDLAAAQKILERLALFDELTGLGNRVLFTQQLEYQLSVAKRESKALVLLVIDLDGFKAINDRFGHAFGDAVLREFSARLKGALRDSDQGFRIGGDEFVVLLHAGTPLDGAIKVARKIEDETKRPLHLQNERCVVGASIGIAAFPEHQTDPERLVRAADAAMYRAKKGPDSICIASTDEGPTDMMLALTEDDR